MAELNFYRYTVKHLAAMTGKSEETVRDWIADGKLKAHKDRGGRNWVILIPRDEDPTLQAQDDMGL